MKEYLGWVGRDIIICQIHSTNKDINREMNIALLPHFLFIIDHCGNTLNSSLIRATMCFLFIFVSCFFFLSLLFFWYLLIRDLDPSPVALDCGV